MVFWNYNEGQFEFPAQLLSLEGVQAEVKGQSWAVMRAFWGPDEPQPHLLVYSGHTDTHSSCIKYLRLESASWLYGVTALL